MKAFQLGLIALVATIAGIGEAGPKDSSSYVPKEGFVPDKEVAIKIAVAVWEPIYGAEKIATEKPYRATLTDGVWTVEGSLPSGYTKGGVALAEIAKLDGRIIRVIHGK